MKGRTLSATGMLSDRTLRTIMTIHKLINKVVPGLLLILGSTLSFNASANIDGEWHYITSFNAVTTTASATSPNHCRKILDGERYTYFVAHSRPYYSYIPSSGANLGTYGVPAPVIFRVDNNIPATSEGKADIVALSDVPGACGTTLWDAAYSGVSGLLAVAYMDGTIGLYGDDGSVREVSDFRMMNIPVSKKVNTVTFDTDGNRIYMAGVFGYLTVDASKGCVIDICLTPNELGYAFRVGDHMVVTDQIRLDVENKKNTYIVGKSYSAPLQGLNGDWSKFQPIMVDMAGSVLPADETKKGLMVLDGELRAPVQAMPFNENTACFVTNTSNVRQINVAAPGSTGTWTVVYLEDQTASYEQIQNVQDVVYEGYVSPTRDGWGFWSGANYICYDASNNIDFSAADKVADYKNRARKHIGLSRSGETENKGLRSACFNYEDAWFYFPFRGWSRMHNTTSDNWAFLINPTLPNSPTLAITNHMAYHPQRGLVLSQFNGAFGLSTGSMTEPTYMCVRKDGVWTDLSPMTETAAIRTYLGNGTEIAIDPFNDKYLYYGTRNGLVRRNLDDPSDLLILGSPGGYDALKALPGYIEAFPMQQGWKNLAQVQSPIFDEEGNLWFAYRYFYGWDLWICKWERSAIDASIEASKDRSKYVPFKHLFFDTVNSNNDNIVYPCGVFGGKDMVLIGSLGEEHKIHLGEIDWDGIEPTYTDIYSGKWMTPGGDELFSQMPNLIMKPRGIDNLLICFPGGVVQINPADFYNGGGYFKVLQPGVSASESKHGIPVSMMYTHSGVSDPYSRIWFGTETGLYCYTADGEELLGRWSADNSPMVGKVVYGVCWDDEAKALIAANEEGLWEFKPFQNLVQLNSSNTRVWPSAVEPDFNGHVAVSGIPDGVILVLTDKEGNQIANFNPASGGSAQWDLKINGERASSGLYGIKIQGHEETIGKVTVY